MLLLLLLLLLLMKILTPIIPLQITRALVCNIYYLQSTPGVTPATYPLD